MTDIIDSGKENKPRRLEETDEIVVYLSSLDQQLSQEGLEPEDYEVLVENVLSEIKSRSASAASDRRTNIIIEKLILVSTLPQLVQFMKGFSPYSVFLARNRFSSHLMQAVMARFGHLLKSGNIGDLDEADMATTALEFIKPLIDEFSWLAKDMCASHVIRSALCMLAGMPCVSEKKGKDSKHQHSVAYSQTLEAMLTESSFFISKGVCFFVPEEFHELLGTCGAALLSYEDSEIQSLLVDSSSCALLGLLLRVLYSPDVVMGGPELAERVAKRLMRWKEAVAAPASDEDSDDAEEAEEKPAATAEKTSLFYEMAGDRAASYFLEVVLECCSPEWYSEILSRCLSGTVAEYVNDNAGNFVVQAALRRLSSQLTIDRAAIPASSSSKSGRSTGSAKAHPLLVLAESLMDELLVQDLFVSLLSRKAGVVLWMIEVAYAAMKYYIALGQVKEDVKIGSKVLTAIQRTWAEMDGQVDGVNLVAFLTTRLAKRGPVEGAEKAKVVRSKFAAPSKFDADNKDSAQLLISRLVGALLKLETVVSDAPCSVSISVSKLPTSVLLGLASTGLTSRSVFDSFFTHVTSSKTVKVLINSFKEALPDLACHHAGQHVLRQLYEKVDETGKETIVTRLAEEKDRLNQSKEGRNTLRIVHYELWSRQPQDWRSQVKKQAQAMDMLNELEGFGSASRGRDSHHKAPVVSSAASAPNKAVVAMKVVEGKAGDDSEGEEEGGAKTGRKRKRKRAGKGAAAAGGGEASDEPAVAAAVMAAAIKPAPASVPTKVITPTPKAAPSPAVVAAPVAAPASADRPKTKINPPGEKIDHKRIAELRSGKLISTSRLQDEIKLLEKEKASKKARVEA